jgi:hypothetical protein
MGVRNPNVSRTDYLTLAGNYRTIFSASSRIGGNTVNAAGDWLCSHTASFAATTTSASALVGQHLDATDYPVPSGLSARLRMKVVVICNHLGFGRDIVFKLFPVTVTGSTSDQTGIAVGTGVCPVTITSPGASSLSTAKADIAFPAWAEPLAFIEGRQFVFRSKAGTTTTLNELDTSPGGAKPDYRARTVRNRVLDFWLSEVSAGTQRVPQYEVTPTSPTRR